MTRRKINTNEVLIGAAIASLLGGVAAIMMAPSGKKLRRDLSDAYCNIAECTNDTADKVSKTGKNLANSMRTQSHDWADKAKCLLCGVKNFMGFEKEHEEETEDHARDLLIGGAIGGLLGALTGLLLAPKPGNELRDDIVGTYEDVSERSHEMADQMSKKGRNFVRTAKSRAHTWINVAKQVVDTLTDQVEEKGSEIKENTKSRFNEMADWASLGLRVWQEMSKK